MNPRLYNWIHLLALSCALVLSCSRKDSAQHAAPAVSSAASVTVEATNAPHDPAHPPIDCPLRKQGIDPAHMRPFEDIAKYIDFLERPDRLAWQKPDEVVTALGVRGTETIFDLGAGSGYFSFRFAAAVPAGRVIAADTEAEMIRHIHHRVMTQGIQNVQVRLIKPNEPNVDASADLVFICDVLHHVTDRAAWLKGIASVMKSGARLVLIEFKEGKLPEGPPETAKIPRAELLTLAVQAGFALEREHERLLPYQVFLEFRKP